MMYYIYLCSDLGNVKKADNLTLFCIQTISKLDSQAKKYLLRIRVIL
jgi:hypothetical protein